MTSQRKPLSFHRILSFAVSPFAVGSISRMGSQFLAFFAILVASKYLSLSQFGLFALASAVSVIIVSLLYTGLYESLLRSTRLERDRNTVFWMLVGFGSAGGVVMAGCGAFVGKDNILGNVFLVMAIVPLIAGPTAWAEALIVRNGGIRTAALCTLGAELLGFVALLAALNADYGVGALVASRLTASFASLLSKFAAARSRPLFRFDWDAAQDRFKAALPLYATSATAMFSNYGVDLVLGLFLNPAAVGAYRAGSRITTTASDVVVKPMHAITWSGFSRLERNNDRYGMRLMWLQQTRFLTIASWPGLTVLGLASVPLVEFLFAKSWIAAAPVVSVLAFARAGAVLEFLAAPALICSNRAHLLVKLRLAALVVLMILLALMAPYGPEAAAGALLATNVAATGVALALVANALEIRANVILSTCVPAVLLSCLCAIAVVVGMNFSTTTFVPPTVLALGVSLSLWVVCFLAMLRIGTVRLPEV